MRIVCTGPECTGKTTLSRRLAQDLGGRCVDEAARQYLRDRPSLRYTPADLLQICSIQSAQETSADVGLLVADTDLQVLYVWWQEKFGPAPRSMSDAYANQSARYYLLCKPDLTWVADDQRENPHDRMRLFDLYEADLIQRGLTYGVVEGEGESRYTCARAIVRDWNA